MSDTRPAHWLPNDIARCQALPGADGKACPERMSCKRHLAWEAASSSGAWVPVSARLCDSPAFVFRIPVEG